VTPIFALQASRKVACEPIRQIYIQNIPGNLDMQVNKERKGATMRNYLVAGCLATLLSVSGVAQAGESHRLSDDALDSVTAAAVAGTRFIFSAVTDLGSSAGDEQIFESGSFTTGGGGSGSDGEASVDLRFRGLKISGPGITIYVAGYWGEATASGSGSSTSVEVDGVAEGSLLALTRGRVLPIDGTNRFLGYTIGIGIDKPHAGGPPA
jgi:hypothetical protein